MTATCVHSYSAFISCDGKGYMDSSLVFGPYTVEASAIAHIEAHGAVCTGLGEVGVASATCRARIFESYDWQDS